MPVIVEHTRQLLEKKQELEICVHLLCDLMDLLFRNDIVSSTLFFLIVKIKLTLEQIFLKNERCFDRLLRFLITHWWPVTLNNRDTSCPPSATRFFLQYLGQATYI